MKNASRTHQERKAYTTKEREEKKELEERKEEDIIISDEIKKLKEDFERFNKWLDSETTFIRKIKTQMTEEQFIKLKKKYNSAQITKTILSLENYKDAPKRYQPLKLSTFKRYFVRPFAK